MKNLVSNGEVGIVPRKTKRVLMPDKAEKRVWGKNLMKRMEKKGPTRARSLKTGEKFRKIESI